MDKHAVSPGAITPAREMLAQLLLMQHQPKDALAEFAAVLKTAPNRFNALYGAATAADAVGDAVLATKYFRKLTEIGRRRTSRTGHRQEEDGRHSDEVKVIAGKLALMKEAAEQEPTAIRTATLTDARRLAELSGQLGYPANPEEIQHRLARIRQDPEQVVYVLEIAGAVQGWIHVAVRHLLETGTQAEIAGLVIDESCRGQGAGRRLVIRAEEWARSKHCSAVRVRSNVIRERAHAFYQQLGYHVIKTQKVFQKELAEAPASSAH